MEPDRWRRTKNPARILASRVRYGTGLWAEHYIESHGDKKDWTNKKHKVRRAIWEYAIDSEGDSNCIEMPLLGKIIKWQSRKDHTTKQWHKLHRKAKTPQEKKRVEKLWKKLKHEEAMMDKWLKFEDPRYVTRAEEEEDFHNRIVYYQEHGEFPDRQPLLHGVRRLTDEEWQERKKTQGVKPPIEL